MRTMLRISMATEGGNRAIKDGVLPQLINETTQLIKPEATYFVGDQGRRTAYFFFDMNDSSQMPVIAERWYNATNATIEFMPAMNAEDLRAGLDRALRK